MRSIRAFVRIAAALAVLVGAPRWGAAQVIRGTVVDSATGTPVGAGFIVLVDTLGNELVRALTARDGTFEIRSPRTGFVRLRSERIGYRPWESPRLELHLRQSFEYTARVTALPVQLATIETRSETSCRMRDDESRAVALLWEEARKALTAASWNARQGLYRQTLLSYERDLDERRRRVNQERTVFNTGMYEIPYRSRDPQLLADQGYVTTEGGANWYYAPDANVLLDEAFHGTHCFKVVEGEDEFDGLIGLGFEPVRRVSRPDVRGTLWIDLESAELKVIEYSYTGLPDDIADSRIGGTIEFLAMPSGAWIVHKWQIRTPFLRNENTLGGGRRQVIDGFRDTGGEVLVVTTVDGDSVYSAPKALVEGSVVDSSSGDFPRPLRGAVVSIVGTSFSALVSDRGEFRMDVPLSGTYDISFTHPRTDSLGLRLRPREVTLEPGVTTEIALAIGSIRSVMRELCDDFPSPDRAIAIVGVARDRYAAPVADAVIEAYWQIVPVINEDMLLVRESQRETKTDADGRFVVCDVPTGALVTLRGVKELNGTDIEGSVQFRYEAEQGAARVSGPGQPEFWVYVMDPIMKIDISMFPEGATERR